MGNSLKNIAPLEDGRFQAADKFSRCPSELLQCCYVPRHYEREAIGYSQTNAPKQIRPSANTFTR